MELIEIAYQSTKAAIPTILAHSFTKILIPINIIKGKRNDIFIKKKTGNKIEEKMTFVLAFFFFVVFYTDDEDDRRTNSTKQFLEGKLEKIIILFFLFLFLCIERTSVETDNLLLCIKNK